MDAWYFLAIGARQAAIIKRLFGESRRGFGSLPVTVRLGTSTWRTSIFPTKAGTFLLPVKAAVRRQESIGHGDRVTFSIEIRT